MDLSMTNLAPVLVLVLVAGAIPVMILVVVFARTYTGPGLRLPTDPSVRVVLAAHVIRPSRQLSITSFTNHLDPANYGTLTVTATDLQWRPDTGLPWSASLAAVTVTALNRVPPFGLTLSLDIFIDGSGPWRLVVSDRPINRFVRNTAKTFRQARTANLLARCLVERGARSTLDMRAP